MSASDSYALHARLIGAIPRREEDLFVSIGLGFLFWGFAGACFWRWRTPRGSKEKGDLIFPYKTDILLGLAISCVFLGLGYWVRAGLSGSDPADQARPAYIFEQICSAVASLVWVDLPAMTVTRDEIMFELIADDCRIGNLPVTRPLKPIKHWIQKVILGCRVLWIVAGLLLIIGFVQLPDPADARPATRSTNLRLAGSLIVFLLLLFMLMLRGYASLKIKLPKLLVSRLIVLWLILCATIPALYNFLIVAVTDDSIDLIRSKVFFYFAYAFFPALMIGTCIALELNLNTGSAEFKWFII